MHLISTSITDFVGEQRRVGRKFFKRKERKKHRQNSKKGQK